MNRGAELREGLQVGASRVAVDAPEMSRLPETLQDEIRRRPVVFIAELAMLLDTSERTILRQLRAGTFFIPEMPRVDKRHRWSRARVYLAVETATLAGHARQLLTERRGTVALVHDGSVRRPRGFQQSKSVASPMGGPR